jgi:CBS domain-containing protein
MTKQPLHVGLDDSLQDAYRLMRDNCIRHLPVMNGGKLVGIISHTDLERVAMPEKGKQELTFYTGFDIGRIMTKNVHTIQAEDSIKDAAELLSYCNYHAVPVLEGENLVGIVTSTDIINYMLENFA